jgi:hypothetical protein
MLLDISATNSPKKKGNPFTSAFYRKKRLHDIGEMSFETERVLDYPNKFGEYVTPKNLWNETKKFYKRLYWLKRKHIN